jgi:hypothetical protein
MNEGACWGGLNEGRLLVMDQLMARLEVGYPLGQLEQYNKVQQFPSSAAHFQAPQ